MGASAQHEISSPSGNPERIVEIATRLFAEFGFDGVSTRQIGAETGLNIATVHHHVGTKRDLYLRVIEALFEREKELVSSLLDDISDREKWTPSAFRHVLRDLISGIVGLATNQPARQRLYVRRWLEEADALCEREAELTLSLYRRLAELIESAQSSGVVGADLDTGNFLRSFDWLVMGYFTSGAFDWTTLRTDPIDPARLKNFETFLHDYAERMLGLAPGSEEDENT